MTKENAELISKLFKEKSELLEDLSKLISDEYNFAFGFYYEGSSYWGISRFNSSKIKTLNAEIKEILIIKIKLEIDKIDLQLNNL